VLRILRQGQRWIMLLTVIVVGGVFVAFVGVGGPLFTASSGDAVVQVGDRRFSTRDVLRTRAQQEDEMKRVLGDGYDATAARTQLDLMATNALVQKAILAAEAERLGLRVPDDEIVALVKSFPAFRDEEGRFRPDAVRDYVEYEYGTERRFLESLRTELLAQKALELIGDNAAVSEMEAREALRRRLEEVEVAYVALDTTEPPDGFAVDQEAASALLTSDEARVRTFFEEHPERYDTPERARARHILVRVAPDAGEEEVEAARQRAEALRERVAGGEDFAKVARENTDDPGSKTSGGDLGFFRRGQMVKPFEEAAFALEPGALSDVVRSDFGFHVIRLEEKQPAREVPYEEAREDIARELLTRDAAAEAARTRAEALAQEVSEGESLEDAARRDALTLERPPPLRRRPDGFVPGLGAAPDLLDEAFRLDEEAPSSPRIFEVEDKLVLVQLLARRTPDAGELAAAVPEEQERLLEQERNRLQAAWLQDRQRALNDAGLLRVDLQALDAR